MLILICILVLSQAYIFKWIIPVYHIANNKTAPLTTGLSKGYAYLLLLLGILIALASAIIIMGKKNLLFKTADKV